ncbi:IscS subfamily cysteine desulfurase [Cytobacillus sp. S13-E01]|uniref:IscS subfamily cysteine desulfurase n=1 Tax=Cytobacillus sp. S13-E01 TaxID=3031326 RepID=UPI0023D7C733|nr:IscS subfamily cysteine desulfurase [Cytobacillus sp. S13-E01]MDF0726783.1 IscS subfamily cysteine desulfurase [Cytobacillus sp. S13-E01]
MIYLDYAATTPMRDEALQVYSDVAKKMYGNPSSLHDIGTKAKNLLEGCREELALLLNADTKGIYFTSGGSDANILAIQSLISANRKRGNQIITTQLEHSSILNLCKRLEGDGYIVTYLHVNSHGEVDLDELENAITDQTILASIHHVNSEIGVIQPLKQISAILKKHNIIFHSDCVQSFGKLPLDVIDIGVDSISISSHKIYGPKGVGAVYINPIVKWQGQFPFTTHEGGFRPGTVNVPGISGFVTAAQLIYNEMTSEQSRILELRKRLIDGVENLNYPFEMLNDSFKQLPNILGLLLIGIEGQYTMLECNRYGIAISTGSACQVGQQTPSKTMLAIGKSPENAKQFIRLSFGKYTTTDDIDKTIDVFKNLLENKK